MKKLLIFLLIAVLASCEKDHLLCQNSPPTLRFSIRDTKGDTASKTATLRITYVKGDSKSEIPDTNYRNGILSSYDLVMKAHELGNSTVFSVEADGVKIADLTLRTYLDQSDCDGWVHASEVKSGNKVLEVDKTSYAYVIQLPN